MLSLLLIQPENPNIRRHRRFQLNNFSQLTIAYLAACADEKHYRLTLCDERARRVPYKRRFDLVAITVSTPNAPHCYQMAARFRENGAKIVMGGPHATLMPVEVAEHCDHLLTGEAEDTWPEFLEDFRLGKARKLYASKEPPPLKNLPPPRWDLRGRRRGMKSAVIATRGCPYACHYCNLKQIYHPGFRTRPVREVTAEIAALPTRFFVFWDDNLFADRRYAKEMLRAIIPLKRRWAAQVTLRDCADGELLSLAKQAGCVYLFIGLETFSESSLADAGKTANRAADYAPLIQAIHRHGIMVQAGIVFGFDSDGPGVYAETLRACEALGIDGATVSILTPFPGTPVYERMKAEGRLLTGDWSRYDSKTAVAFAPKRMTSTELLAGYQSFRKRIYSLRSFLRRARASRTNLFINFFINLGYRLSI